MKKKKASSSHLPIVRGMIINIADLRSALVDLGCIIDESCDSIFAELDLAEKDYGFTAVRVKDVSDVEEKYVHDILKSVVHPEAPGYYGAPETPFVLVHHTLENCERPFGARWVCYVRNPEAADGYSVVIIQWFSEGAPETCHISCWTMGVGLTPLINPAFSTATLLFGRQTNDCLAVA